MQKYANLRLTLGVASGVTGELPTSRDAVGLGLAELLQDAGDLHAAVAVVEQLELTT